MLKKDSIYEIDENGTIQRLPGIYTSIAIQSIGREGHKIVRCRLVNGTSPYQAKDLGSIQTQVELTTNEKKHFNKKDAKGGLSWGYNGWTGGDTRRMKKARKITVKEEDGTPKTY